MKEHKLTVRSKIPRRAAHDLILFMAKYSNHHLNEQFVTDADVKRALHRNKVDFDELVQQCRDYNIRVPFFENLVGSTITIVGEAKVTRIDRATGQEDLTTQGPGTFVMSGYWAAFEAAVSAREKAIANSSNSDLLVCVVQGIASIEGYLLHRADIWNKQNPNSTLTDTRENKVGFDAKVDDWIPKMASGKQISKGGREWNNFKKLRRIRDDEAVHPKATGYGFSFGELAERLNLFRAGIAGLLLQMHLLFEEKVPAIIIRAAYAPEVYVEEIE